MLHAVFTDVPFLAGDKDLHLITVTAAERTV
jgi:hypothetical protein